MSEYGQPNLSDANGQVFGRPLEDYTFIRMDHGEIDKQSGRAESISEDVHLNPLGAGGEVFGRPLEDYTFIRMNYSEIDKHFVAETAAMSNGKVIDIHRQDEDPVQAPKETAGFNEAGVDGHSFAQGKSALFIPSLFNPQA